MLTNNEKIKIVVLIKQVPDISNIPPDAWNEKTGILNRNKLDSFINPMDLKALSLAKNLKENNGGQIIVLTMGPPSAKDALTEAFGYGIDKAILLTDRSFAGSDTYATSYILSSAIKKIIQDSKNYIIISGKLSDDGDTGQVPIQISEELNLELVPDVVSVEDYNEFIFNIDSDQTHKKIKAKIPFLITTNNGFLSNYPLLTDRMRDKKIKEWSNNNLNLSEDNIGLKGSKTQVISIFKPKDDKRDCKKFTEAKELIAQLERDLNLNEFCLSNEEKGNIDNHVRNDIFFVYIGMFNELSESMKHLIYRSKQLANQIGSALNIITVDFSKDDFQVFQNMGVDVIHNLIFDHKSIKNISNNIQRIIKNANICLFGDSQSHKEIAARVSYSMNCGLTADCTELSLKDVGTRKNVLCQTRSALGGNIMATIISKDSPVQIATVKNQNVPCTNHSAKPKINEYKIVGKTSHIKVIDEIEKNVDDLSNKELIISGGNGFLSKEEFLSYTQKFKDLSSQYFNLTCSVGGSRKIRELGFIEHTNQIGQTGCSVAPKIYFAIGISGSYQHIVGIKDSHIIVAINKDEQAEIFKYANYGIVGDYKMILPQLFEAMKK